MKVAILFLILSYLISVFVTVNNYNIVECGRDRYNLNETLIIKYLIIIAFIPIINSMYAVYMATLYIQVTHTKYANGIYYTGKSKEILGIEKSFIKIVIDYWEYQDRHYWLRRGYWVDRRGRPLSVKTNVAWEGFDTDLLCYGDGSRLTYIGEITEIDKEARIIDIDYKNLKIYLDDKNNFVKIDLKNKTYYGSEMMSEIRDIQILRG